MSSWVGRFGPGFFRTWGENRRRHFRFVSARWRLNSVEGFRTIAERISRPGRFGFAVLLIQAKPNFTGTWTLNSSNDAGSNAIARAVVVFITQNDSTLTLKTGDRTLVWQLDGSETAMKIPGPTGPQDLRLRARLEGARLLVEQRTATTSITQTVSLSDDGNELTVETVAQTPQGEQRGSQLFKKS
jgi:hypothetical protein